MREGLLAETSLDKYHGQIRPEGRATGQAAAKANQ